MLTVVVSTLLHADAPSELWHSPQHVRGTPVADSAMVYVAAVPHRVVALDVRSGALRWTRQTGTASTIGAGPILVPGGGALLFVGDGNIVALRRQTGEVAWTFSPSVGYGPGLYPGSEGAGLLFAGSPAGRLYAIDIVNGVQRWSAAVTRAPDTTVFEPATDGRTVVAAYTTFSTPPSGGIAAYDAGTGRLLWRRTFHRTGGRAAAGRGGGPLLSSPHAIVARDDGVVRGYRVGRGDVEWTSDEDDEEKAGRAERATIDFRAMTIAGNLVVAGSLRGDVTAYRIEDGRRAWHVSARDEGSVGFRIAADERCVYVPLLSGAQLCLRPSDGREQWRIGGHGIDFFWPPAVADGRLYYANADFVGAYRRP
jgi:outer membrane protein assembly factor BamB